MTTPSPKTDLPSPFRKLSVLVTVRNQERLLRPLLERLLSVSLPLPLELIVVDDGSADASRTTLTELALADPRLRTVFHVGQRGRSAALRTAIQEMTGDLALVVSDLADNEPDDYANLLRPMLTGAADVVYGSRMLTGSHHRITGFQPSLMRRLLAFAHGLLFNVALSDGRPAYHLLRGDILRALPLTDTGDLWEIELTAKLSQWEIRLCEVAAPGPSHALPQRSLRITDLLRSIWANLRYRYFDRRFTTHEGFFILQGVRQARGFNRWMLRQIRPFLGKSVLEAGCGIGNFSDLLLDCDRLVCLDNDSFYINNLERRFALFPHVAFQIADLAKAADYSPELLGTVDTVVCMNVLEHIADDVQVLKNFFRTLKPGGNAIVLVPAHPRLFNGIDQSLDHQRRYTEPELRSKFAAAGFEIVHAQGFNRLGTLGWFVSGSLLGRRTVSPRQMRLYEALLPLAKFIEPLPLWPQLSVMVVGRKPAAPTSLGSNSCTQRAVA